MASNLEAIGTDPAAGGDSVPFRGNVHPAYRPDIDGLRAVAVLAVLAFHAFPSLLPGGFIGVDVFFVISGYLISRIIMGSLERDSFSFRDFYARRIKRIFPALLLVLAAVLAFGWISLFAGEYRQLGKHAAAGAAFVSNLVLWGESGYFDNAAVTKPLLHLWSLGVEEQFYIFWPLFLWLARRLRFNFLGVAGAIAAVSFALNILGTFPDPTGAFYSPLTRFWELMLGAMLAYGAAHPHGSGDPASRSGYRGILTLLGNPGPALSLAASLLGIGLIAVGVLVIRKQWFPGWQALLPTVGAALLILAGPDSRFNRLVLSCRPMVWLGLISYPLYLWHWPLLSFARIIHGGTGPAARVALLLISGVLAWLTYALLEVPLKEIGRRRPTALGLGALMAVAGCVGLLIMVDDGVRERQVVQENISLDSGLDGGVPPFVGQCGSYAPGQEKLFQCRVDSREAPRFALLGDSKAAALSPGLFRTSAPGGTWISFSSGTGRPLLPVLSDSPIYRHIDKTAVRTALQLIAENTAVETVVVAAAARALFHLGVDYTIEGLPKSKNAGAALEGLDASVSFLLDAGKRVVLLVDNPTLPHMEDCLGRTTSLSFLNGVLTVPPDPACRVPISRQLELSRQYRDVLSAIQERHPGKVSIFDTTPILCDEQSGICGPTKNGRFLYGLSDHLSEYGSRLVGQRLNAFLHPEAAADAPPDGSPAICRAASLPDGGSGGQRE